MDAAHRATDKELERIEKKLTEIYKQAAKELGEKADKYFERFKVLDQQKRALVKAGKMSEADYKKWRHGKIMTGEHWKQMQKQTAQRLTEADRIAAEYTNGRLPYVYALNYNSVAEGLETRLMGYSFDLVDEATVRNLAESDKTLLPYKIVDGKKAERWHTARVNAEVTQGILQGESIPKIAKRLKTNVGMTAKGSAVRNARTSVTSAENKGRIDMLHDARKKGVIADKIWIAAHDSRTREAHLDLDGQQVPEDEMFKSILGEIEYPGDPSAAPANTYNCRCSLGYKVVGFGEESRTAEEDTSRFVPAESISGAEDYAKQFLGYNGSASYKGIDVKYANTCNRVLTEVKDKFDFGTIHSIQPMNMRQNLWKNSTSEAAYRWGSGDLFINPKYYKTEKTFASHKAEIDSLTKTVMDGGHLLLESGKYTGRQKTYVETLLRTGRQCVSQSHDFVEGTFVHECGHMLDDKVLRKSIISEFGAEKFHYQEMLTESREKFGVNISGYAVTDNNEYVAETFTAWWYGEHDKCDPAIIRAIERLIRK